MLKPEEGVARRPDAVDHNGLEILAPDECLALLRTTRLGRVGVSMRALPVILPVRYGVLDRDIVFRTGTGTRLGACADHAVVAFEADHVDAAAGVAWSVCVTGLAWELCRPDEIRLATSLGIEGLPGAMMDHWVRIRADVLTGRRIIPTMACDAGSVGPKALVVPTDGPGVAMVAAPSVGA